MIIPGSRGRYELRLYSFKMPLEPLDPDYCADLRFIDWEIEKKKKTKDARLIMPVEDLPPKL